MRLLRLLTIWPPFDYPQQGQLVGTLSIGAQFTATLTING